MRCGTVVLDLRHELHLDAHATRERGDLHRGPRGARVAEGGRVEGVEAWEVGHVGEEDRRLHDVLPARASLLEHGGEIREDLFGLRLDIPFDDLAGGGVKGDLAGGEEEAAGERGLTVRADGGGSGLRLDGAYVLGHSNS